MLFIWILVDLTKGRDISKYMHEDCTVWNFPNDMGMGGRGCKIIKPNGEQDSY